MSHAFKLLFAAAMITIFLPLNSAQASEKAPSHFPPLYLEADMVKKVATMARTVALPNAKYEDGKPVGKENPEELNSNLLPDAFEAKVVNHAVFWTTVHWCKLNMSNMGPTLQHLTDSKQWDKKQSVFIPVLHATTHALVREQLLDLGTCTDEFRQYIVQKHKKDLTPVQ